MPVRSKVFIAERLQLAREFNDLTQKELGDGVAASHALISQCETGKKKDPSHDLVEAFGAVLGFKPEFFYQPVDDVFREEECSFRHRRSTPERLKTQIRAHATLIGMVVDKLRLYLKFPDVNVPNIPASTDDEIETAAEDSRRHWKLNLEGPILQVGRVLERAGVIIVPHVVPSTKVDAFSRCGPTTVIFLNQTIQSASRWNFDIAHECGHLVMHSGIHTGTTETEDAANRFASAFLMPRNAFARDFRSATFSWRHVFVLKKRWQTSAAAIIRRAYDLKLLGAVGYRQSFKHMSKMGWRSTGEPEEPTFQSPELLLSALNGLGDKVDLTLDTLCGELHFEPATFENVTGVRVPAPKVNLVDVIRFPSVQ